METFMSILVGAMWFGATLTLLAIVVAIGAFSLRTIFWLIDTMKNKIDSKYDNL